MNMRANGRNVKPNNLLGVGLLVLRGSLLIH